MRPALRTIVLVIQGDTTPSFKITVHGDSITSNTHPTSDPTKNWSRQLAAAIGSRTGQAVSLQQFGIGGHSWDYAWPSSGVARTLLEDAVLNIDPNASPTAKLGVFAGTNGLQLAGHTPEQEAADADTYIVARLAAGWVASNIFVLAMLPRENYNERKREEYNNALAAMCVTRGCVFVPLHEDFDMGVAVAQNDTNFYQDFIHPTELGHGIISEWVYDAIYNPAWTPASLSATGRITLAVHLDAQDSATLFTDAGSTQAADNDLIYTWRDKSGSNFDAVQATSTGRGLKKTYQSKPAIQFGGWGSGDYMQSATIPSGLPSSASTLLIASATDVTGGNHQLFDSSSDNSTADTGIDVSHQGGFAARFSAGGNQPGSPAWAAPFGWTTVAISTGPKSGHFLVNGGRGASGAGTSSIALATGYRVAAPYPIGGFQLGGYFGELIWLSTQALNIDMRRLLSYMHTRWGIDARPDPVEFTPVTGATASATITSNIVTVSGLAANSAMRFSMTNRAGQVTGLEYSINGGAWAAFNAATRLVNGDTVQIRRPASATSGATMVDEIHFGPCWTNWSVTTA